MVEFIPPDHAERVAGAPAEPIRAKYVINMLDQDRWDVKVDAKVAQDLICLWNDPASTQLVAWIDGLLDQQRSCRQAWVFAMEMEPGRETSGPATHNEKVKLPGFRSPVSLHLIVHL
jgi:hypothetical protein